MSENHLPGSSTHPECPQGYVYVADMTSALMQFTLWNDLRKGKEFRQGGVLKTPVFVPLKEWLEKHPPEKNITTPAPKAKTEQPKRKGGGRPVGSKVINGVLYYAGEWEMTDEGPRAFVVRVSPQRKTRKEVETPQDSETQIEPQPKRKGPVPGAKIRRFIQEMVGNDGDAKRPKVPLPDWEVNGGKPFTWTVISPEDAELYVSVYERLMLSDGAKTVNPGALFPECSRAKMIRVQCNETGEIRIVLKEGFPTQVLGTTEERWRMKAENPDSGVSVFFSEADAELVEEAPEEEELDDEQAEEVA